jgi:hypothetical protein
MRGGHQTYPDYLAAPIGVTDIVFPTDFAQMAAVYARVCGGEARVSSTGDLMSVYADVRRTETLDGYNPLILDYANTQFLLAQSGAGSAP